MEVWTNLFLASLFFCAISDFQILMQFHVCHWHGSVDSCYKMAKQMHPCLLAVLPLVTHMGFFLRESIKALRTKDFFQHFGKVFLSCAKNHQNNKFCIGGCTCFTRPTPVDCHN